MIGWLVAALIAFAAACAAKRLYEKDAAVFWFVIAFLALGAAVLSRL